MRFGRTDAVDRSGVEFDAVDRSGFEFGAVGRYGCRVGLSDGPSGRSVG